MTKCEEVAGRISRLIEKKTLTAGERIPSVREMAKQMHLSVMTVLEGYRRLEDRGWLECRPQSGFFVTPDVFREKTPEVRISIPEPEIIRLSSKRVRVSEEIQSLLRLLWDPGLIPLGVGFSSPEFFPTQALGRHVSRAVRGNLRSNQYEIGQGNLRLRQELAKKMMDSGCEIHPNEILITIGGTEALHLCMGALLKPGDEVAVESPGFFGFFSILASLHLRAVEIPSDPQTGLSVTALQQVLSQNSHIRALILCPSLSNPTGASMTESAKDELISLCQQFKVTIIEDDTFGDLSFSSCRASSLKSRDPEGVVFVGSLSKILSPGYRIGWLAGGRHHGALFRYHTTTVLCAPTPTQLGIASFLEEGGLGRHLRRLRKAFQENVARFRREVAGHFPRNTRMTNSLGGHFLWVELPVPCDTSILAFRCVKKGFSIAPGILFSARGHYRRYLRLNAGLSWSGEIQSTLKLLGKLAQKQIDKA
jgi:DNA-binding transcriptional MocR family regulator